MHMELPWMECYLRITHFPLCSPFLGLVCMLHLCAHMKECGSEKSVSSSVCLHQCPPYLSRFSMILNLFFAGRMTLQWAAGASLSPLLGCWVRGFSGGAGNVTARCEICIASISLTEIIFPTPEPIKIWRNIISHMFLHTATDRTKNWTQFFSENHTPTASWNSMVFTPTTLWMLKRKKNPLNIFA